jgi:hypothetical protein
VISLGLICDENGYDYVGRSTESPYLQKEGGAQVYCKPVQNVPVIAPAPEAGGDSNASASEAGGDSNAKGKDSKTHKGGGPLRDTSASPDKEKPIAKEKETAKEVEKENNEAPCSPTPKSEVTPTKASSTKPGPANSGHDLLTHSPKDPNCEICNKSKIMRAQCRRKNKNGAPDDTPKPEDFADSITADHTFLCDEEASRNHDKVALVIQDRFTSWLQAYAAASKSAQDTMSLPTVLGSPR